jgi:adenosylhomocysteine nucleosidase
LASDSAPALCVCGLAAEAKIARRAGFAVVVGAGDYARTVALVEAAVPRATCLVSFGIAGALSPDLRPGDIILSDEVIEDDRRWVSDEALRPRIAALARQIGAIEGPVLGARRIVATEAAKSRAWRETGALAVDMESGVVARAAAAVGIPFLVLRAVADPAGRVLPPAALVPLGPDGRPAILRIVASVLRQPSQLKGLLGLALEARRALAALVKPAGSLYDLLATL